MITKPKVYKFQNVCLLMALSHTNESKSIEDDEPLAIQYLNGHTDNSSDVKFMYAN
jgi:hypothetical protein